MYLEVVFFFQSMKILPLLREIKDQIQTVELVTEQVFRCLFNESLLALLTGRNSIVIS